MTKPEIQGPGGKLEREETPEDCAVREVREELGWDIELAGLLDVWVYCIGPGRTVFVVTLGSKLLSEHPPVVSSEHKEFQLVALSEVDALRMPDGYKRSIKRWAGLEI